jgi:two-component system response regulator MprA
VARVAPTVRAPDASDHGPRRTRNVGARTGACTRRASTSGVGACVGPDPGSDIGSGTVGEVRDTMDTTVGPSAARPDVLVVEDDGAVRRALERALPLHGFRVRSVGDGLAALAAIAESTPDAVILDVGLPGPDGLRLSRRLRQDGMDVPILMLTARAAVGQRVEGLEAGADDYLTKPFALEELVARLNALLRRTMPTQRPVLLRCGDVTLDADGHVVRRAGEPIDLTPTEFRLLELLLDVPGRVITRERLTDTLWDGVDVGPNAIEQHVASLRRKLEDGGGPRLVQTVRGLGYVARPAAGQVDGS